MKSPSLPQSNLQRNSVAHHGSEINQWRKRAERLLGSLQGAEVSSQRTKGSGAELNLPGGCATTDPPPDSSATSSKWPKLKARITAITPLHQPSNPVVHSPVLWWCFLIPRSGWVLMARTIFCEHAVLKSVYCSERREANGIKIGWNFTPCRHCACSCRGCWLLKSSLILNQWKESLQKSTT